MTKTQIDYWNYVENARHNSVTERETKRSNEAREYETNRSNLQNESINRERNAINASFNQSSLAETKRANLERERQRVLSLQSENRRIDLGYAQVNTSLDVAKVNAGVGYSQVALGYANLSEQQRSNIINEDIKKRSTDAQVSNAFTSAKKEAFEEQKWSDIGLAKEAAGYNLIVQQSKTEQAKREQMAVQNKVSVINAGSNVLGSVGNLTRSLISTWRK